MPKRNPDVAAEEARWKAVLWMLKFSAVSVHACDVDKVAGASDAPVSNGAPAGGGFRPDVVLTARSLYRDSLALLMQCAVLPTAKFNPIAATGRLDQYLPFCAWRLDYSASGGMAGAAADGVDIDAAAMKILLRGRLGRASPYIEEALSVAIGCNTQSAEDPDGATLLRGVDAAGRDDRLWFDGAGVEDRFYHETLGKLFPANLAQYVIPQAHLAGLTGVDVGEQRVDFLINLPGQKIVVELDDPKHEAHADKDEARDAALAAAGFRVVRIPYTELQGAGGPQLAKLEQAAVLSAGERAALSAEQRLIVLLRQAHQFQVAVLMAMRRGPHPRVGRG